MVDSKEPRLWERIIAYSCVAVVAVAAYTIAQSIFQPRAVIQRLPALEYLECIERVGRIDWGRFGGLPGAFGVPPPSASEICQEDRNAVAAAFPQSVSNPMNCSPHGGWGLFVALFDGDTPGGPPAPTAPLVYGPPNASLDIQGPASNALVVNSTELSSNALHLMRGGPVKTVVRATVGDVPNEIPYSSGVYELRFWAHAPVVPDYSISKIVFLVLDDEDKPALGLALYDGQYHIANSGALMPLAGSYDPTLSHFVFIRLDLDQRDFGICINDEVVAEAVPLIDDSFGALRQMTMTAPAEITEAFAAELVFDQWRAGKRM